MCVCVCVEGGGGLGPISGRLKLVCVWGGMPDAPACTMGKAAAIFDRRCAWQSSLESLSRPRISSGAGCVGQLPAGDGAGRGGWCGGRRRRVAGASNTDVSLRSTYSFLGPHIDICHRIRRSLPAARRGGCLSGAGRGVGGTTPIIPTRGAKLEGI